MEVAQNRHSTKCRLHASNSWNSTWVKFVAEINDHL